MHLAEASPNRHEMKPEDADRMSRLSEEVRSRVLEMALITARTVGRELPKDAVPKFIPQVRAQDDDAGADAGGGDWMEIIEEGGFTACYGVINGHAFAESPCGAAGPL
jgi:hypothetical protein